MDGPRIFLASRQTHILCHLVGRTARPLSEQTGGRQGQRSRTVDFAILQDFARLHASEIQIELLVGGA